MPQVRPGTGKYINMYIFNVRESFQLGQGLYLLTLGSASKQQHGRLLQEPSVWNWGRRKGSLKGTMLDTQLHKCPCLCLPTYLGFTQVMTVLSRRTVYALSLPWVSPHTQSCLNSCSWGSTPSIPKSDHPTPSLAALELGILWHSYHQEIHELNPSHGAYQFGNAY